MQRLRPIAAIASATTMMPVFKRETKRLQGERQHDQREGREQ